MSEAVGIQIDINSNTQSAEKKVERLDKKLDRLREKSKATREAIADHLNSSLDSNGSQASSSTTNNERASRQILNPKESGTIIGKSAGSIIGNILTGYFGKKTLNIGFDALRSHGQDNTAINRGEKIATNAGGGALAMAMIGGGPLGLIAGAIGGGALGLSEALLDERRTKYQTDLSRWHSDLSSVQGAAANIGGGALAQLLSIAGSREARSDILMDQIRDVNRRRRGVDAKLENVRDPASIEHQYLSSEFTRLTNLEMGLWGELAANKTKLHMPMLSGQEATDALAKRGIYTGGQIDISAVNAETRLGQQEMITLLREMVSVMREGSGATGEILNELLIKIKNAGTL